MKKLLMGSVVLTIFALSITLFQISCKKEAAAQSNPALTKEEILVQKTWKIDQLHRVIGGVYASYFSGGVNTTGKNYDLNRYTFNSDGTGIYIGEDGKTYNSTWQFTSSDKRTMTFSISLNGSTPSVNNWVMVEIAGNYLHVTQNFTVGGNTNNLHSFRLIQIP